MAYWYATSPEAERWHLTAAATLDEAIAEARAEYSDGYPFTIGEAEQQPWRYDCFDDLDERFDGANEELGDGDGDPPSVDAGLCVHGSSAKADLVSHLELALRSWVEANGNPNAWALNFSAYHDVPATAAWHAAEQAPGVAA